MVACCELDYQRAITWDEMGKMYIRKLNCCDSILIYIQRYVHKSPSWRETKKVSPAQTLARILTSQLHSFKIYVLFVVRYLLLSSKFQLGPSGILCDTMDKYRWEDGMEEVSSLRLPYNNQTKWNPHSNYGKVILHHSDTNSRLPAGWWDATLFSYVTKDGDDEW